MVRHNFNITRQSEWLVTLYITYSHLILTSTSRKQTWHHLYLPGIILLFIVRHFPTHGQISDWLFFVCVVVGLPDINIKENENGLSNQWIITDKITTTVFPIFCLRSLLSLVFIEV